MALRTSPYKGARDFYPEDKRVQSLLFKTLSDVCERYGYEAYDAPILEPTELYLSKGNTEIIEQQTYTFTDRGDRSVTMRTEMTPSVSRMVAARRQELAYPLRWYSIPQCWRYERMQRGRGREFYQLNVDIFGENTVAAEHELLLIVRDIFASFGADESHYSIRLNSRALMKRAFREVVGLPQDGETALSQLIDRMHKIEPARFESDLSQIVSSCEHPDSAHAFIRTLLASTNIDELPKELQSFEETAELRRLIELAQESAIHSIVFDPTIMRGFDYYTGIVFEVVDKSPENTRSMFGGGRYDSLVADFGVDPVPTVGFGMGDLTLLNFLETHGLLPDVASTTDLYVIVIGDVYKHTQGLVARLRDNGLRVAIDTTGRKIDKCIKAADKKQIPYVLFVGASEVQSGTYRLKNIQDGNEQQATEDEIAALIKKP